MIEVSIKEFIRTGDFGPVKLGMSKDEVIDLLGNPDSDNKIRKTGSILLYSWYELFFDNEKVLKSIQNDHYQPNLPNTYKFSNAKFRIEPWILNADETQTIDSIAHRLKDVGIDYEKEFYYERYVLRAKSGVIVDFDDEENNNGIRRLIGVRYWP